MYQAQLLLCVFDWDLGFQQGYTAASLFVNTKDILWFEREVVLRTA